MVQLGATNEEEAGMDGESFDAVVQRVSVASRRGVLRAGAGALAGVALAGVGLIRPHAEAEASGKRCCRKQRRRFLRAQQECEAADGVLITPFSCDRATCDPDVTPEWLCEVRRR
jgi:hypothetical protein